MRTLLLFALVHCIVAHQRKKVGLTMSIHWQLDSHAVAHHVYFIYDLLERSNKWEPTLLILEPNIPGKIEWHGSYYRAKHAFDYADMDVVVESGGTFLDNRLKERYPHIKSVHFNQGPFYFAHLVGLIDPNKTVALKTSRRFDAIWVTPQYEWQAPYMSEWTRTDKWAVTPYLWSPKRMSKTTQYQPGTADRIGVYETNRGVYKMSMVPIMIGNRAYRRGANISYFEVAGVQRIWNQNFQDVLNDMDLDIRAIPGLVYIPQHYSEQQIGTIVSHHLRCGLNYLHLEALYMNMSLVHNSEFIQDCGYYYHEFDIEEGARVLQHAMDTHDQQLDRYAAASAKCLWRYAPEHPENLKAYENLLEDLF